VHIHSRSCVKANSRHRLSFFEDELEKVAMVGASHSSRMTDELDDTCLEVVDISVRGWKISEKSVDEKVKELTHILNSSSSSFKAQTPR
jgi:hypothetical protein